MSSLYQKCKKRGFNFFIGVPGSELEDFIKDIERDEDNVYIPANREDSAVAIAVGAYFAGKKPLVFLQNSGLGNIVNITTSLLKPYAIPMHFVVGVRKTPIEHSFMYKITKRLVVLLELQKNVVYVEED